MDQQKPESIRSYIVERYRTFRRDAFPQYQSHFANLAHTQNPKVLFIACSDSRVVPTMLLSGLPGDIFECRIVGNIVPAYGSAFGGVSATLEYAISVLKVEAVIICGHSDCGAMKALQAVEKYESVKPISTWLHNADAARRITDRYADATNQREYLQALTRENVLAQLENAKNSSGRCRRPAAWARALGLGV